MMPNGMNFVGGQADPSQKVAMALLQRMMQKGGGGVGQGMAPFLPMLMQKMQNDPSRQVF